MMKKRLSKRTILKLTNPKNPIIFEGRRYETKQMDKAITYSEGLIDEARDDYKRFKSMGISIEVIQGEY